jgi:hypothetical protein
MILTTLITVRPGPWPFPACLYGCLPFAFEGDFRPKFSHLRHSDSSNSAARFGIF